MTASQSNGLEDLESQLKGKTERAESLNSKKSEMSCTEIGLMIETNLSAANENSLYNDVLKQITMDRSRVSEQTKLTMIWRTVIYLINKKPTQIEELLINDIKDVLQFVKTLHREEHIKFHRK